jgi:hypothetical protein
MSRPGTRPGSTPSGETSMSPSARPSRLSTPTFGIKAKTTRRCKTRATTPENSARLSRCCGLEFNQPGFSGQALLGKEPARHPSLPRLAGRGVARRAPVFDGAPMLEGRTVPTSLTSFCTERKAQRNRGYLDFVGLQNYRLGGAEKSGANPSFTNWSFRFLGMSVMTTCWTCWPSFITPRRMVCR